MRVGVAGALGKMGRVTCTAIAGAPDLELVAGFARRAGALESGLDLFDDLDAFYRQPMDVVVDFTTYPATVDVARKAVAAGVAPVIGATGWKPQDVVALRDAVARAQLGALLVPNFAIGAVILMRLAELAAPHFRGVEIVEMHHETKKDKPSGTAQLTAERIEAVAP
ncbi:MAG: 4-hydroxy-tetrahydrodipicolinate reductase, partial [Candidatus Eremiobacteraeota bacterium]|nr:4-hydroxy-tetrahydrodipicolinate reductase [Candidatus Eremiobacteraeota bacterium]